MEKFDHRDVYANCSDILPNWRDMRNRFVYTTLSEMFGCLIYTYTCHALKVKGGINNVPR